MSEETLVCYEQPLTERIRLFLRLEFLFVQAMASIEQNVNHDTRFALQTLIDIVALTTRNELKSEILKELDRQSAKLQRLRRTPEIDNEALSRVLSEIQLISRRVHDMVGVSLEGLRQHEFLNAVRQRMAIPSGACSFDLPALHHWLQSPLAHRQTKIERWLRPLYPIRDGVLLILRLIRESALPCEKIAENGFYQQSLDSAVNCQLVRVHLDVALQVFAEISGGRHRLSIHFLTQTDPDQRPQTASQNFTFQLACCTL